MIHWFLYISFGFVVLLFIGFVGGMIVAGSIDLYNARKNQVWNELQRTDYKPRRPAAK